MLNVPPERLRVILQVLQDSGGTAAVEHLADSLFPGDPRLAVVSRRTKRRGGRLLSGVGALLATLRDNHLVCGSEGRWTITHAGKCRLAQLRGEPEPPPPGPKPPMPHSDRWTWVARENIWRARYDGRDWVCELSGQTAYFDQHARQWVRGESFEVRPPLPRGARGSSVPGVPQPMRQWSDTMGRVWLGDGRNLWLWSNTQWVLWQPPPQQVQHSPWPGR